MERILGVQGRLTATNLDYTRASGRLSSIYLEKNDNSGAGVADESGQDARTAHDTLYRDAEHPSILEIPILKP